MLNISKDDYKSAAKILKNGGLVAFPTETVYGLGCISNSEEAFNKLVNAKKRPPDKPFTLMCSTFTQVEEYIEITPKIQRIVDKFMPGPLTIVLKTKENVPHYLDLGTGFIGVRIPKADFVLKMINEVGSPLLVPSANISSFPPAKTSLEVINYFKDNIDGVVEENTNHLSSNLPSTVVRIDKDKIVLLRLGAISVEELEEA